MKCRLFSFSLATICMRFAGTEAFAAVRIAACIHADKMGTFRPWLFVGFRVGLSDPLEDRFERQHP